MSYSVHVVAKHLSNCNPIPFRLVRVERKSQLTWSVIKFLILKNIFRQFNCKYYDWDVDGYFFDSPLCSFFSLDDVIPNNSTIVYKKVPIHYREKIHFIPYAAGKHISDIDEEIITTHYF